MTIGPYASDALISQTEALIGQRIGQNECTLLKQINEALALKAGYASASEALGGAQLGQTEVVLLKQVLVQIATS